MDFEGFKAMLPELDPEVLKFVYRIFDSDMSGTVGTQEFLMTFALLTEDCQTLEQQLDA